VLESRDHRPWCAPTTWPGEVRLEIGSEAVEAEWAVEGRMLSVRVGKRCCDIKLAGGSDPAAAAREIAVEIVRADQDRDRPENSETE